MILFELVNFEGSYQDEAKEIREVFASASKLGSRWIEWSLAMAGIVDKPDVSIVSSRNMLPKTLRKIIESRKGLVKVLYGPPLLGFEYPAFDKGICAKDLERLLSDTISDNETDAVAICSEVSFRSETWMKTIPMPLPLSR